MTPPRHAASVYELTVAGGLGPVLRAVFAPATTLSCGTETILCLRGHDGDDLVDVLHLLWSQGLDVVTIHTIR